MYVRQSLQCMTSRKQVNFGATVRVYCVTGRGWRAQWVTRQGVRVCMDGRYFPKAPLECPHSHITSPATHIVCSKASIPAHTRPSQRCPPVPYQLSLGVWCPGYALGDQVYGVRKYSACIQREKLLLKFLLFSIFYFT